LSNGGQRKLSGWHKDAARRKAGDFYWLAAQPTRWERLLARLYVDEDQALALLAKDQPASIAGTRISAWVEANWRHAFVPEAVLLRMGYRLDEVALGDNAHNRHWLRTGAGHRGLGE
jgi:hypothetical protein